MKQGIVLAGGNFHFKILFMVFIKDIVIITLLSIAALMHLLRLIYVVFKPVILDKYVWLHSPDKIQLCLYYILVISASVFGLINKFS